MQLAGQEVLTRVTLQDVRASVSILLDAAAQPHRSRCPHGGLEGLKLISSSNRHFLCPPPPRSLSERVCGAELIQAKATAQLHLRSISIVVALIGAH